MLLQPSHRELLEAWLAESSELYLDLDRPHSGGSNSTSYFLTSLAQLDQILAKEKHPEVCLSIFRKAIFPLRGVFDEALLETALDWVDDQKYFCILIPDADSPGALNTAGGEIGAQELREEFSRLANHWVAIGHDPFDEADFDHFFHMPDEVFVLGSYLYPEPHVRCNQPTA